MDSLTQQPVQKLPDPTEELLLPEGWKQTLPTEQHLWVSKALFTRDTSGKLILTESLQQWWYPPEPQPVYSQPPPLSDPFFHSKLFLWMPCRMFGYRLMCTKPNCRRLGNHLRHLELCETVRRVLDLSGWYFIATEYLECSSCKKKVPGWSQDILDQLDLIDCEKFPAVLTYRLSCDKEIVRLMQDRAPRKSVTELYKHMCVRHKERWLVRSANYLSVLNKCEDVSTVTVKVPQMIPVPSPSLLLSVYVKDALARLVELKARVTSIRGSVLTMASTVKVTKKHANPVVWATSVGNEVGQVLTCVMTQAETGDDLRPMCSGLIERYRRAGEAPPKILYVDHDCCGTLGKSKAAALFQEWDHLVIRLDAYQFMRHFSAGVTSESHPLYNFFMGRLFSCVFEWDAEDLERLHVAKHSELESVQHGLPTNAKLSSTPTYKELARHCRHYTRGAQVTKQLIEQLLKDFLCASDPMGNRLVDQERMEDIWRTQQCHLSCIQDFPGVELYKKCRQIIRGGIALPVYSSPRGLASLESFDVHLNNFIPVTSLDDSNFHVYLLEGMVCWNEARAAAVDDGGHREDSYYCRQLQHYLNDLSQKLLGCKLVEDHTDLEEYTGELIGVEYLYSQTNRVLEVDHLMDPDAPDGSESDEGLIRDLEYDDFKDLGFDFLKFLEFSLKPIQHQTGLLQSSSSSLSASQPDRIVSSTSGPIKDESSNTEHPTVPGISQEEDDDKCLGPDGVPGYDHVINLANSLVDIRNYGFITQHKVDEIVSLWEKLSAHDKGLVVNLARHEDGFSLCINGLKSRVIEAICLALSHIHPAGQTIAGVRVNRWAAILRDYNMIRDVVLDNTVITARTNIQLFSINQQTLCQWYNSRKQRHDQTTAFQQCIDHMASESQESFHYGDIIKLKVDASGQDLCVQTQSPIVKSSSEKSDAALFPKSPATITTNLRVPRTTAWRRRKAQEKAAQRGLPVKRLSEQYVCTKCGQPKTKEFGHSQFHGIHFCAKASGKTVAQWMEEMKNGHTGQGPFTHHM